MPLIEAFHKRVPVLAYAATAVPATMDGGGVLYDTTDPHEVAAPAWTRSSTTTRSKMPSCSRRMPRSPGCAARDFAGTLLRFVDQALAGAARGRRRASHPTSGPSSRSSNGSRNSASIGRAQALRRRRRPVSTGRLPVQPDGSPIRTADLGRPAMIVNQWVPAAHIAATPSATTRAACAGCCARQGHAVRDLRADDRRRPARRRPAVGRTRRRARGDVTIFHFALPSPMTEAFATLPRRARAAVPQRHAGARSSRPTTPASSGSRRSAGTSSRRSSGASIWRSASPTTTGRSSRRSGSSRPACCRSPSTRRGSPARRAVPALETILQDGLVNILFVGRIAPNKRIEDHIRLAEHYKRYVDVYYRFIFVGQTRRRARGTTRTVRALIAEYQMLAGSLLVHRAGARRRTGGVLPARRRLRLAERARGLLRAAASRRWRRTCRCWPTARRPCPRRWAAPACRSRRRISSSPPSCSARSSTTTPLRAARSSTGQRAGVCRRSARRPPGAR